MEESNIAKFTFHTKSGEVSTYAEVPMEMDVEEIAASMVDDLATRPRWMAHGNVVFFSGAVSAITIDIHDAAEAAGGAA